MSAPDLYMARYKGGALRICRGKRSAVRYAQEINFIPRISEPACELGMIGLFFGDDPNGYLPLGSWIMNLNIPEDLEMEYYE